jgi:DNA-binding response OmpR family regulator
MAACVQRVSGVRMKKTRILVIDDEPSVVDALKMILSDKGYEAASAVTAREALELARRHPFDVAIIDLKLPDLSGLDLFRRIAEGCADTDGILITAYDSAEVRADAVSFGFAAVLPKPFSPRDLLDSLGGVLSQRRARSGAR